MTAQDEEGFLQALFNILTKENVEGFERLDKLIKEISRKLNNFKANLERYQISLVTDDTDAL